MSYGAEWKEKCKIVCKADAIGLWRETVVARGQSTVGYIGLTETKKTQV